MIIAAFNESKDMMDWLEDIRVHPEISRDVLVKRIKRGWIPEVALTTPVIKGSQSGDDKARKRAREDKMKHRFKMFRVAQNVRLKNAAGVEHKDIMKRYDLSRSQVEKMVTKNEYYNIHWSGTQTPAHFKEIQKAVEEVPALTLPMAGKGA